MNGFTGLVSERKGFHPSRHGANVARHHTHIITIEDSLITIRPENDAFYDDSVAFNN